MKIVAYSNHDIDTINDWIVAENIKPGNLANKMLKAVREGVEDNDTYYYKLVEDDYKLKIWEP